MKLQNRIDYKQIFNKYNLLEYFAFANIGNDGGIYISSSGDIRNKYKRENKIVHISVDWNSGAVENVELLDFSRNFDLVYSAQPIDDKYYVCGKLLMPSKDTIENFFLAYVVDKNGNVIREVKNSGLLDSKNRAVTGYFDEQIYDGTERYINGLYMYDDHGNTLWENKTYNIANCYYLDIDDKDNIWFYPDNKLVKVDTNNNFEYSYYDVGLVFSEGFLLNKSQSKAIFKQKCYDGYSFFSGNEFVMTEFDDTKFERASKDIKWGVGDVTPFEGAFKNHQPCIFTYDDKHIEVKGFCFRNSKAVLWDYQWLYYFEWE